ncbi:7162_t:CDS:10 [Cetraspora pellucida]|uniref:7162_t:CDS:1 n=1 Tax=Cetraspora pellucida TaxID=1433469 RepID=A0A9N9I5K8_9GLOM|nr:7162_t:CDS:10 [Cetraspora pellucida]
MHNPKPKQNDNIDRLYTPQLKFTNFAAQAPIVTKYVTSKFLRHDVSYFQREETKKEPEQEGSKVLVIHPGSKYLRIGRASEAFPYVVPHQTDKQKDRQEDRLDNRQENKQEDKQKSKEEDRQEEMSTNIEDTKMSVDKNTDITMENDDTKSDSGENWSGSVGSPAVMEEIEEDEEQFTQVLNEIRKELKDRMKTSKRRPVANAQAQVLSFNKSAHPETIADHNDPYKVDWTVVDEKVDYYVGEKALRLHDNENHFKLFYPIQHGEFNTRDYNSIKAVVGDLETIWTTTITEKLEIPLKNFKASQESVCVSFGAGISVACIVDIGAQTSTVACVEDGMCIPDSRICLRYGGDDITTFFIRLLRKSKFPYAEMDLNRMYDWMLAEEMKEKFCTLDECFFYPHIINFHKKSAEFPPKFTSHVIDDITEGVNTSTGLSPNLVMQKPKLSVATQVTQAKTSFPSPSPQQRDSPGPMTPLRLDNSAASTNGPSPTSAAPSISRISNASSIDPVSTVSLDDAIIQSINAAATEERAKKFYGSILLVGGGGLISGIHKMLENRIFSRTLPFTDKFEILGSPRDLDPRLLAWKGGSVMSKLEIVNELWINSNEWEELGVRCLREKALFVW